jgi:hypothetical protein
VGAGVLGFGLLGPDVVSEPDGVEGVLSLAGFCVSVSAGLGVGATVSEGAAGCSVVLPSSPLGFFGTGADRTRALDAFGSFGASGATLVGSADFSGSGGGGVVSDAAADAVLGAEALGSALGVALALAEADGVGAGSAAVGATLDGATASGFGGGDAD